MGNCKKTIENATGTVNENGNVTIAEGTYSGINNTNITIKKNMTIQGLSQAGTIINGTGTNRIFKINNGVMATIINLTITNATRTDGGAISNSGTLTLTNTTFTNNIATTNGGAIYNWNGNCTVTDSIFTGNNAPAARDAGVVPLQPGRSGRWHVR